MKKNRPPAAGQKFLRKMLPFNERKYITEGLEDLFAINLKDRGKALTLLWYWKEILCTTIVMIKDNLIGSVIMLKDYLKIAFRNMRKNKFYTLINFISLTMGITGSLLVLLFIDHELNYDKFHVNQENIYRMILEHPVKFAKGRTIFSSTPPAMKEAMVNEFPEIINASRYKNGPGIIKCDNDIYAVNNFKYVDPEFLSIFSFPLFNGDPGTVLSEPFSLVITEKEAIKLFGYQDPIGKTIIADGKYEFTIKGVLKDLPVKTCFDIGFLAPIETLSSIRGKDYLINWGNISFELFVELRANTDLMEFENKLPNFIKRHGYTGNPKDHYMFQEVSDVHLIGEEIDIVDNRRIQTLLLYSAVAFLILLIACLNYMNLTTARSTVRSKEVSIRKVVGAKRLELIKQFIGESIILSLLALIISLTVVRLVLPYFNDFINRELAFAAVFNAKIFITLLFLSITVGIVSGAYPAFYLSSFMPQKILKGSYSYNKKSGVISRNTLIIIQYVISIVLIICTFGIYDQIRYMSEMDPGFSKDCILTIGLRDQDLSSQAFLDELKKYPNIIAGAYSNGTPVRTWGGDLPDWEGQTEDEKETLFLNMQVENEFFDFYDIPIVEGEIFTRENTGPENRQYILNETAVKTIGWENPIGKRFRRGVIVGVVKDFHYSSVRNRIKPLWISRLSGKGRILSLKIASNDITSTLKHIENTWKKFSVNYPFSYSFIDEQINSMYETERKLGTSMTFCSLIAIVIATIGLFGLTSFIAEQKTKEISIRKVLGATVPNILKMFSGEVSLWIFLATIIAVPSAWFITAKWLNSYAYRTHLSLLSVVSAALIAQLIAVVAVCMHVFKTARKNPIDSLRYE
ncbi:MAG: ABC transporter permease [Candidatus Aminicenantes bacterium]|nr:ABC transporter permease [Candidatus Aminicenantes bacterium]